MLDLTAGSPLSEKQPRLQVARLSGRNIRVYPARMRKAYERLVMRERILRRLFMLASQSSTARVSANALVTVALQQVVRLLHAGGLVAVVDMRKGRAVRRVLLPADWRSGPRLAAALIFNRYHGTFLPLAALDHIALLL
jgi:hypothetical protein